MRPIPGTERVPTRPWRPAGTPPATPRAPPRARAAARKASNNINNRMGIVGVPSSRTNNTLLICTFVRSHSRTHYPKFKLLSGLLIIQWPIRSAGCNLYSYNVL